LVKSEVTNINRWLWPYFSTATILFFLVLIINVNALSQARTVGVKVGDWAEYTVSYSGNTTLPPSYQRWQWIRIAVLEIHNTGITYTQVNRYADMHEETRTYTMDVETGQGNDTGTFIAANLNKDDVIYTAPPAGTTPSWEAAKINETVSRMYLGSSAIVNHWNITSTQINPQLETLTTSFDYCWFRTTGLCTETSMYQLLKPQTGDAKWMLIEIKILAIIPEFSTSLLLPVFMIVTLLVVIVCRRKHTKNTCLCSYRK